MEKNVGSVNLDELMQARQQLNSERGIETDPNMYKDYNPNRKQEEAAREEEERLRRQEESGEDVDEMDISLDASAVNDVSSDAETGEAQATNGATQETSAAESTEPETPAAESAVQEASAVSDSLPETPVSANAAQPQSTERDFSVYDNFSAFDIGGQTNYAAETTTSESNQTAENEGGEVETSLDESGSVEDAMLDLEELMETFGGSAAETEESTEGENTEGENLDGAEDSQAITDADIDEILAEESPSQSPVLENQAVSTITSDENLSQEDLIKNANDSDEQSEQKIMNVLSKLGKNQDPQRPGALPRIRDVEFIEAIGSSEFEKLEKLSFVLGKNEQGEFEFTDIKSLYDVAVFPKTDSDAFSFFSSMMLSLMLKNSNANINFYVCDSDATSPFTIYSNSSYLLRPVAKSQQSILDVLSELVKEIDSRYEAVATSGTKNIDEYNKAMAESYIVEYPYIVLVMNNYSITTKMESARDISNSLSYILKFGRLVGVYAYVSATEEIEEDPVNYNLASRISFVTETEDESVQRLSVSGAEKLDGDGEFVLKTIHNDNLKHLKVPAITKREVELLIENIER